MFDHRRFLFCFPAHVTLTSMETLGFGSHLILDGFQADAAALADEARVRAVLGELQESLEPTATGALQIHMAAAGISARIILAESHLSLHTFPGRRCFCLDLFSRKAFRIPTILGVMRREFEPGRLESHRSARSKSFSCGQGELAGLLGERAYADVRLDETLFEAFARA